MFPRFVAAALITVLCAGFTAFAHAAEGEGYREAVPLIYEGTGVFSEGLGPVLKDGKWGFVDKAGKEAVSLAYEEATLFSEGLAGVKQDGKWGFIDKKGTAIIPFKYDLIGLDSDGKSFSEGMAAVQTDGKWGFIDKAGKLAVPCKYDGFDVFSGGLALVESEGKVGFIDKTGKEVAPLKYDLASNFRDGMAMVGIDKDEETTLFGYIDKTGKEVIPVGSKPEWADWDGWHWATVFSEGMAFVWANEYGYMIDKTGKVVGYNGNPSEGRRYIDAYIFSEGLAAVMPERPGDGKWGYVDKTSKEVIPFKYEEARLFYEGLAAVKVNGKWGFIDKTGKEAVPARYDEAGDFSKEGLAWVLTNLGDVYKQGFVDKTGREVVPVKYDTVYIFSEGMAAVRLDNKWGYITLTGDTAQKPQVQTPQGQTPPGYDPGRPESEKTPAAQAPSENSQSGNIPSGVTARPSASPVFIDGAEVSFEAYNIDGSNYFKLRDIAYALGETDKRFSVSFDGSKNAISLRLGSAYEAAGGELSAGDGAAKEARNASALVFLDGAEIKLEAYNIGGNNYFKLRDLGKALGFSVEYDPSAKAVIIDTAKPYEG